MNESIEDDVFFSLDQADPLSDDEEGDMDDLTFNTGVISAYQLILEIPS